MLADTIGDGLEQQIEQFYLAHRDLKIVIIDTLQKIRSSEESAYGTDYKELASLKRLADKLAITILLVHHTRKCKDSDPFNMISGSTGLRGCADGALVLIEKDRATHEAIENVQGDCDFTVDTLDLIAGIADVASIMDEPSEDEDIERHSDSKVLAEEIRRKEALGMHMG